MLQAAKKRPGPPAGVIKAVAQIPSIIKMFSFSDYLV